MAYKTEVQYVRYYSEGSAAKVLVRQPEKPKTKPKPKVQKRQAPAKRIVIPFQSVAVIGTTVAVVMLVCMLVGIVQLVKINKQVLKAEQSISVLQAENARLQEEYKKSCDLEAVRTAATSMGMVPRDQVKHISVKIPEPVVEEEPTWWESFVTNFKELFA